MRLIVSRVRAVSSWVWTMPLVDKVAKREQAPFHCYSRPASTWRVINPFTLTALRQIDGWSLPEAVLLPNITDTPLAHNVTDPLQKPTVSSHMLLHELSMTFVRRFIISFLSAQSAQDRRKTLKSCETRCVSVGHLPFPCLGTDSGRIHKAIHNNSQLFVIAEYWPFELKRHITGLTLNSPTVSNSTAGQLISGVCGRGLRSHYWSHLSTKTNLPGKGFLFVFY